MKNLVIVESPAKAKSLGSFLGSDFNVMSSNGHVRDLHPRHFSIDTQTLMPEYIIPDEKQSLVKSLKEAAKKADKVWLASDEDREGEAISWHLAEVLGLDVETTNRIVFHEITKPAILAAIENPRHIDRNLVNAQQARRVLDRIVGFKVSNVLWRKIMPELSAGRVQSVAVRLVVEREREIEKFVAKASYAVNAIFEMTSADGIQHEIKAELNTRFNTADEARSFLEDCQNASFKVESVETKPMKKSPAPPFMTSTLQQEAARKLGFSVSQTMRVAQSLYEHGHITYMRTDSLNLSKYCLATAKESIVAQLGKEYSQTRNFQTRTRGAQEAHEAIRPTQMDKDEISGTPAEKRLYHLIYQRTIASQMSDALYEKVTAVISVSGKEETFVATGEVMKFDGYTRVYHEAVDDEPEKVVALLPALNQGEVLTRKTISATERFTQRPLRYSEGSLVHKMEELGIGRPSTYAPTISTIQARKYVIKDNVEGTKRNYTYMELLDSGVSETVREDVTGAEKGKLIPTDIGKVVNDYLIEWFPGILDLNFTAKVEQDFDTIAEGNKEWNTLVKDFYTDFIPQISQATETHTEIKVGERQLGRDPKSGRMLSVKIGRYGRVAQLGLSTDDERPVFAQLRENQSLFTITLEEALELFKLPRELGQIDGKPVVANVSRYGPYINCNGQNVSIPKGIDVMEITLDEAAKLLNEKAEAEKQRQVRTLDSGIEIKTGRYGPYLAYNGKNYRLPKNLAADLNALTDEQCREVIEKADQRQSGGGSGHGRRSKA